MNEFETVQAAAADADQAISRANNEMKKVFYQGREIVFRRGNMKENHNCTVISSGHNNGHAWIYINNLVTGKKRNISIDDVQGI